MKTFTIGRVAQQAGVSVETIRFYERQGILEKPLRRPSGYRQYDPEVVRLIRFIKRAQELGFTLNETKQLSELRDNPRRKRSEVRILAEAKANAIDRKLERLQAMREALDILIDACACKNQKLQCPIIEALYDDCPERK